MKELTIDFETRSFVDLKKSGAARYAEDDTTEILCMSYKFTGEKTRLWTPYLPFPDEIIEHINEKGTVKAHNVAFEWNVWRQKLFLTGKAPMPTKWRDSMAACAYRALPMGLDQVGKALDLDVQKSARGKYLLGQLSKPKKATKAIPHLHYREEWELLEELFDYCIIDTDSESLLDKTIGDLPDSEQRVWVLDRKINRRGLAVDVEAVTRAKEIVERHVDSLTQELIKITNGRVETGNQRDKFLDWMRDNGVDMPNLQKATVEQYLFDPDSMPDHVYRALEIRQAVSKNSLSKLDSFLACTCQDGRIRELIQYHGATTGRFAGRLVQPHNFPRGTLKPEEFDLFFEIIQMDMDVNDQLEMINSLLGNPLEVVSSALRGMFIAGQGKKLMLADFAAIEARVVMWVAGCQSALDAFFAYDRGEGPDIYCVMAESLYGHPVNKEDHGDERNLGKMTILGCGYQMGPPRFQEQALSDYGMEIDLPTAEKAVYGYRNTYPEVVNLWAGLQEAAISTVAFKKPHYYKCIKYDFVVDDAGEWLVCILPNGRKIWYYQPEVNQVYKFNQWMPELSYMGKDNKKGGAWGRISTYGGMLTENVVQAISRDLMIEAMIRVESKGYPIILTVHDEIVSEPDEGHGSLEEFCELMKGPVSSHFAGCPVNVEGWEGYRYRKV